MTLLDTDTPDCGGPTIAKARVVFLRVYASPRLRVIFFLLALPAIGLARLPPPEAIRVGPNMNRRFGIQAAVDGKA